MLFEKECNVINNLTYIFFNVMIIGHIMRKVCAFHDTMDFFYCYTVMLVFSECSKSMYSK